MTRIRLALSAAALMLTPIGALAQDGLQWGATTELAADPFQSIIVLAHGVPETDNVQFLAQCQIGAGGPYALVQIAADTAGLQNGAATMLSFTDGAGAGTSVEGSIIGVGAEVGITGVEMAVDLGNGLFNLMRVRDVLSYAIPEGQGAEIVTAGVAEPLNRFLTACADPALGAAPQPGDGVTCDAVQGMASLNGEVGQRITFTNGTDGSRGLIWMDYTGSPVEIGSLNPGEAITIDTYLTHPWMITDGPGNCLEAMLPQAGQESYAITAPNRNFGNE
ncbi:MAG: VHL beta domain-containing protein [Alterinioella nitratireducens]|uniref:VHL beta domain-containing protein n=1 Tax=Alterinioella nitratireducens TaxID=2735915 RepID=UPI00405822C8